MDPILSSLPSLRPHPFSLELPEYAGPLDLLLRLVERAELAITAISLEQVTGQYLAFMRAECVPDHRALADFVAIGARLMELKSRALLPAPPPAPYTAEEEDPEELVELLLAYQRFKAAAALLREREEAGARAFPRLAAAPDVPELPGLSHVTLDRLLVIVQRALAKSTPLPEPPPIQRPRLTVRRKMEEIRSILEAEHRLSFAALMERCASREEIITSFLAVLELIKSEGLVAVQEGPFADILLMRDPEAPPRSPDVQSRSEGARELEAELSGVE